jgi:hypothetical protein
MKNIHGLRQIDINLKGKRLVSQSFETGKQQETVEAQKAELGKDFPIDSNYVLKLHNYAEGLLNNPDTSTNVRQEAENFLRRMKKVLSDPEFIAFRTEEVQSARRKLLRIVQENKSSKKPDTAKDIAAKKISAQLAGIKMDLSGVKGNPDLANQDIQLATFTPQEGPQQGLQLSSGDRERVPVPTRNDEIAKVETGIGTSTQTKGPQTGVTETIEKNETPKAEFFMEDPKIIEAAKAALPDKKSFISVFEGKVLEWDILEENGKTVIQLKNIPERPSIQGGTDMKIFTDKMKPENGGEVKAVGKVIRASDRSFYYNDNGLIWKVEINDNGTSGKTIERKYILKD